MDGMYGPTSSSQTGEIQQPAPDFAGIGTGGGVGFGQPAGVGIPGVVIDQRTIGIQTFSSTQQARRQEVADLLRSGRFLSVDMAKLEKLSRKLETPLSRGQLSSVTRSLNAVRSGMLGNEESVGACFGNSRIKDFAKDDERSTVRDDQRMSTENARRQYGRRRLQRQRLMNEGDDFVREKRDLLSDILNILEDNKENISKDDESILSECLKSLSGDTIVSIDGLDGLKAIVLHIKQSLEKTTSAAITSSSQASESPESEVLEESTPAAITSSSQGVRIEEAHSEVSDSIVIAASSPGNPGGPGDPGGAILDQFAPNMWGRLNAVHNALAQANAALVTAIGGGMPTADQLLALNTYAHLDIIVQALLANPDLIPDRPGNVRDIVQRMLAEDLGQRMELPGMPNPDTAQAWFNEQLRLMVEGKQSVLDTPLARQVMDEAQKSTDAPMNLKHTIYGKWHDFLGHELNWGRYLGEMAINMATAGVLCGMFGPVAPAATAAAWIALGLGTTAGVVDTVTSNAPTGKKAALAALMAVPGVGAAASSVFGTAIGASKSTPGAGNGGTTIPQPAAPGVGNGGTIIPQHVMEQAGSMGVDPQRGQFDLLPPGPTPQPAAPGAGDGGTTIPQSTMQRAEPIGVDSQRGPFDLLPPGRPQPHHPVTPLPSQGGGAVGAGGNTDSALSRMGDR